MFNRERERALVTTCTAQVPICQTEHGVFQCSLRQSRFHFAWWQLDHTTCNITYTLQTEWVAEVEGFCCWAHNTRMCACFYLRLHPKLKSVLLENMHSFFFASRSWQKS